MSLEGNEGFFVVYGCGMKSKWDNLLMKNKYKSSAIFRKRQKEIFIYWNGISRSF